MNTITNFITITNLKGNRVKLSLLLIVPSILYSSMLMFLQRGIYQAQPIIYYVATYLIVLGAAYVFMNILFQFIHKKRGLNLPLKVTSYMLPLLGVQTILFVLMMGAGIVSLMLLMQGSFLSYIMTAVCVLFVLFYIPVQVFSFFFIYDGWKNPFQILWLSLKKIWKHYRLCFYALLSLFIIALCYQIIISSVFGLSSSFNAYSAVQNIMVQANPFIEAIAYILLAPMDSSLWGAVIIAMLYGVVMCVTLVYYYMLMLCAYDEDIKI